MARGKKKHAGARSRLKSLANLQVARALGGLLGVAVVCKVVADDHGAEDGHRVVDRVEHDSNRLGLGKQHNARVHQHATLHLALKVLVALMQSEP